MAQTKEGAMIIAAKRLGVNVGDYKKLIDDGYKHCGICRKWYKSEFFNSDSSRGDGLSTVCRACQNKRGRSRYKKKPRPAKGRKFVGSRDGDKKQARRRINYLVEAGLVSHPFLLPCSVCGHSYSKKWGDCRPKRHEYHHHKGYSPESHEDVIVLCSGCHSFAG